MNSFRFRLARWIMAHRNLVAAGFVIVSVFLSFGLPHVQIKTIFKTLLPKDDPFVQVYYDHPNFGSPLTLFIMIKAKHGTIYNHDTLEKVWKLSRAIDLTPGVDHDQIMSIATPKLRYAQATPEGINMRPVMGDSVPSTPAEIRDLRLRIDQSPNARTFFVSPDESSTLIMATFLDSVDYGKAFKYAHNLVMNAQDANHDVYLAGQPILIGWVYKLEHQTLEIFGITLSLLTIALIFYMRNVAGVVTPIVCAGVAALWGFGFIGWVHRPVEPLLMIVPLLLIARTFSHCIQYTERYYEVLTHVKDKRKAAEITMAIMMAPSILGIMTDVFGIAFIAVAPIVTMYNHAMFCGMWAFFIIPTGVFLISILLSWLPEPKNIDRIAGGKDKESGIHLLQKNILDRISRLTYGRLAPYTTVVVIILTGLSIYQASKLKIGNPVEGSGLLFHDSEYNTAVRAIDRHFPGMNTLEIVIESKKPDDTSVRVARTPEVAEISSEIQAMVEEDKTLPPSATISFTDYMMEGNRLFNGGNPKWMPLDPTVAAVRAAGTAITFGSNPVNFSNVTDYTFQNSTISLFYKDNTQPTINAALAAAEHAVKVVGADHPQFRIRLASGGIALQEAMNRVVERYHWVIMGLVNVAIMIIAAFAYRSLMAAIILLIPVNISNFMLLAAMETLGIGFDINALIVAVMGVGVGIDYGIYLLSRICEEYTAQGRDWGRALNVSLTTTGKAILFTATIMLVGILPWYFLSDLRFMAGMGMLLVVIMLINMLLSLIVLPLIVWLIKPKFAGREDLALGENVDLSLFMDVAPDSGASSDKDWAPAK